MQQLTKLLEAALFSAARPLALAELQALDPVASYEEIRVALNELREQYQNGGHGVELAELADGFQVLTRR